MSNTIEGIIGIFERFRKPGAPDEDLFDTEGRKILREKIGSFVSKDEPVEFVLPGFPAKSPNHAIKTLGYLPDGAEEVALSNLVRFATLCNEAYAPGVRIRVITDGLVFGDIVGLSKEIIREYYRRIIEMTAHPSIVMMTPLDFFQGAVTEETALKIILDRFGENEEAVQRRIKEDADTLMLFNGLSRFMQTDIVWPEGVSKNQIRKQSRLLGKQMLMRSEAYSRCIAYHYPLAVRLSSHPSTNAGTKFSWQFIPGDPGWNTPWHNTLCVINGQYRLMKRVAAEEKSLELVSKEGQPYYYRDQPSDVDLL